jgi:hypothetical protein
MRRTLVLTVSVILAPVAGALSAQQAPASQNLSRPSIFFDCDGPRCNEREYFRTEIDWVNWVNVRENADVHVIMTSQQTGGGGRAYQVDLVGVDGSGDYEDQVIYTARNTDTDRETLDGISHAMAVALARFAVEAGFRGVVQLTAVRQAGIDPAARVVSAQEVDDPWNLWTFRLNGSGSVDGEETEETTRLSSGFSATRVTPTWKLDFDGSVNFSKRRQDLDDGAVFRDENTDWSATQLVVYTIADHWSIGTRSEARKSRIVNQRLRLAFEPAIEYSVFPYEEATRRSLTAFYRIGPTYYEYDDSTAFGEIEETRFRHSLDLELSQRQPWGEASVSVNGATFLHDTDLHSITTQGNVEYRIFRGLSVNARATVGWVRDQIYLSARGRTDEEALLNLIRGSQDFDYCVSFGFTFQFGSVFNNVVNNRFSGANFPGGGGGGGGGGFGRCRGF